MEVDTCVFLIKTHCSQGVGLKMSTMSANIESHIVSILKRDVSEDQMMDSNSRLEGHIRQENLIGSTDAGEMCLSEARLQSV